MRLRRLQVAVLALPLLAALSAQPAIAGGIATDLTGVDGRQAIVDLPAAVDAASSSTVQEGHRGWFFILRNDSPSAVTNPTINVNSGYSPSAFRSCPGGPLASFPFTTSQASLASGQSLNSGLCSTVPVSFTTGFDSARSVKPLVVPPGGGRQDVVVTMTLTDARYLPANVVKVSVLADSGDSIACDTASAPPPNGRLMCTSSRVNWTLNDQPLGAAMRFAVSVDVANPSRRAIFHKSRVWTLAAPRDSVSLSGPSSSSSIADSTLDGGTPGAGGVTFSVAETSLTWSTSLGDNYWVDFTPFRGDCPPAAEGCPG